MNVGSNNKPHVKITDRVIRNLTLEDITFKSCNFKGINLDDIQFIRCTAQNCTFEDCNVDMIISDNHITSESNEQIHYSTGLSSSELATDSLSMPHTTSELAEMREWERIQKMVNNPQSVGYHSGDLAAMSHWRRVQKMVRERYSSNKMYLSCELAEMDHWKRMKRLVTGS